MAIKYLAGDRLIGTTAERTALSGTTPTAIPATSWKLLDYETLEVTASSITVSGFAAKDNLMVLFHGLNDSQVIHLQLGSGGTVDESGTNGVDGNYAGRRSYNNGTDGTDINQSGGIRIEDTDAGVDSFCVINIRNVSDKEKLIISHAVSRAGSGATTPNRSESVGKWVNTSAQANVVKIKSGGTLAVGSQLVVLGCDDDEEDDGTNFFEELTYKKLDDDGELRTDTFTGKDYILVQALTKIPESTASWGFNDDLSSSSGNYGGSGSANGGSAYNSSSTHSWFMGNADHTTWEYVSAYIVNKPTKNKLGLQFKTYGTAGASNAPSRIEFVGNWNKTDQQITRIKITRNDSSSLTCDADSNIRVWGGTAT